MGHMSEISAQIHDDDQVRRLMNWHRRRYGAYPDTSSITPVSLPVVGGEWEILDTTWERIEGERLRAGKTPLRFLVQRTQPNSVLGADFDDADFRFHRGQLGPDGKLIRANPDYVKTPPRYSHVGDDELDRLVRWHKFRYQVYPTPISVTPIVEPQGTEWVVRPGTWASINSCRVLAGKSPLRDFCLSRGYVDRRYASFSEADVAEEGDQASAPELTDTEAEVSPKPDLTNAYLIRLINWYREKTGHRYPGDTSDQPVWIRQADGSWGKADDSWPEISRALAAGERGVETVASSISDFVRLNKPPLTPALLKQYLRWSVEHDGRFASSGRHSVWLKTDQGSWVQSLYLWNEIDKLIQASPDTFKAGTLADFKKRNGYLKLQFLETGIGWLDKAPDVAARFDKDAVKIPVVPLPRPLDMQAIQNLRSWHLEQEGREPERDSATQVWIRQEDGSWAKARQNWASIFSELEGQIRQMQRELAQPPKYEKILGRYL